MDTVIGKRHRQTIVILAERKSRFALLRKVERRTADTVHTITGDNGKEFAEHERIARDLEVEFFFTHPYSAWERGANENMSGLVRQYVPKNRDLTLVIDKELLQIVNRLNHRPRKCLEFSTPYEVFFGHRVALRAVDSHLLYSKPWRDQSPGITNGENPSLQQLAV